MEDILESKKLHEMPDDSACFVLNHSLSDNDIMRLSAGHESSSFDDKWEWCVKDNKLFIYRRPAGYCIYIVDLSGEKSHNVTVNRDISQYPNSDIKKDIVVLSRLLNVWTSDAYDYYKSWLADVSSRLIFEE